MSRTPDPPHLRVLKNDKAHAHRYKNKDEVDIGVTDIKAPETLSPRAKEIFNDMLEKLESNFQISELDVELLVIYANNQEQLEAMEAHLREHGVTYIELGMSYEKLKERPEVSIHDKCKNIAIKLLASFAKLPKKTKIAKKNAFADLDEVNG